MLEAIRDGSQTHLNINRIKGRYKIRDPIRQKKLECKGEFKSTQSMEKGLHKLFSTFVKEILQEFTPLVESDSEVFH